MLKIFFALVLTRVVLFSAQAQSIPNAVIKTIDGDSITLNQFSGKKIIIMTLPVSHSEADSLMLLKADSAYQQFKDSLAFIGVPSYEDGYTDSLQADIKYWYRDVLHLGFIITTGMYTHSSSESMQSSIFKWLTVDSLNGHFSFEINKYGQKFMLNEQGEIKAVLDETTSLTSRLLRTILSVGVKGN